MLLEAVFGRSLSEVRAPAVPAASRGGLARAGGIAVAALMLACGSELPEERLAEAREALGRKRGEVAELESRVIERRDAVHRAEEALAKARRQLESAEQELAQARAHIEERATDVALFRAVQGALLEHEALEGFAIRARVEDGVVTLRGEVREPAQAKRALETARAVARPAEVRTEIRVRNAPDPAAAS